MLRNYEWEWRRYDNNSGTNENWNYVTNKSKIQRYWEERVEESKGYSAMYTLGMRGVHDWGISGYPSTQDKVRGLTEIISFQRSLLEKHIGDPTTVPQIFIPYKEVLDGLTTTMAISVSFLPKPSNCVAGDMVSITIFHIGVLRQITSGSALPRRLFAATNL